MLALTASDYSWMPELLSDCGQLFSQCSKSGHCHSMQKFSSFIMYKKTLFITTRNLIYFNPPYSLKSIDISVFLSQKQLLIQNNQQIFTMYLSTVTLLPLVAFLSSAIFASPFNNYAHQASLVTTLDTLGSSRSDIGRTASCGNVNGNCYENGCEGQFSPDRVTCTQGKWDVLTLTTCCEFYRKIDFLLTLGGFPVF